MSHYHILSQSLDKQILRVVFHYPVPTDSKNTIGIHFTEIIKQSCDSTSQLPDFENKFPEEYQAMQDGLVIERLENIRFNNLDFTPNEKKQVIRAEYEKLKTIELRNLQTQWQWNGFHEDIA